jgi:hypothetical protein
MQNKKINTSEDTQQTFRPVSFPNLLKQHKAPQNFYLGFYLHENARPMTLHAKALDTTHAHPLRQLWET